MKPLDLTDDLVAMWGDPHARRTVIGGPDEGPDVIPCPALVTYPDGPTNPVVVRVAYDLEPMELAALRQGGTLWLSTWGGLPVHSLLVTHPGGG